MNVEEMALWLEAQGIGRWSPEGSYDPSDTGIFYRVAPAKPPTIITLSPYSISDHVTLNTGVLGVQVRVRAAGRDPRPTDALAERIFAALQGQVNPWPGAVHVWRQSSASLGQDPGSGTWSRADNYYINTYQTGA